MHSQCFFFYLTNDRSYRDHINYTLWSGLSRVWMQSLYSVTPLLKDKFKPVCKQESAARMKWEWNGLFSLTSCRMCFQCKIHSATRCKNVFQSHLKHIWGFSNLTLTNQVSIFQSDSCFSLTFPLFIAVPCGSRKHWQGSISTGFRLIQTAETSY